MAKPRLKHLAIVCMNPKKLAEFYCDVFDMTLVHTTAKNDVYVTDGYIMVALLNQLAEGKPCGINHFGFHIEDHKEIANRLKKWDVVGPAQRPPDRTFAELRATDPEGNNYDLAEGGFDRDPKTTKKKVYAPESV